MALGAALFATGCDDDSVPLAQTRYGVTFSLELTTGPVGALQIEAVYRGAGSAGWVGAGSGISCRWIVQATLHACNDKRGGALSCAVVDTGGFTGPTPLMTCELISTDDSLTADDIDVEVVDASAPDMSPIDVDVTAEVETLSFASTTTTTDPDNPPIAYTVTFGVADDQLPGLSIGALQLEIVHDGARGGWLGSGGNVDCQWLVDAEAKACNEQSNRLLVCAVATTAGFTVPRDILECGFASSDPVVDTSDFRVYVVDVSTMPDVGTIDYLYVPATKVTPR